MVLGVPFHQFNGKTRSKRLNNFVFVKRRQFGFRFSEYLRCSCWLHQRQDRWRGKQSTFNYKKQWKYSYNDRYWISSLHVAAANSIQSLEPWGWVGTYSSHIQLPNPPPLWLETPFASCDYSWNPSASWVSLRSFSYRKSEAVGAVSLWHFTHNQPSSFKELYRDPIKKFPL